MWLQYQKCTMLSLHCTDNLIKSRRNGTKEDFTDCFYLRPVEKRMSEQTSQIMFIPYHSNEFYLLWKLGAQKFNH